MSAWTLGRRRGGAGELHARSAGDVSAPAPARAMTVLEAAGPAVVLGSTQPDDIVDRRLAAASGWDVTRRRSGGGAVAVGPGRCLWVDFVIPRGDPLWDDDVGRAAWWLGDLWSAALGDAGIPGAGTWKGPMRRTRWSAAVCFSGVGPGEVSVGGRKVVGISQRRTRHGALFQCAALLTADHRELLRLLRLEEADRRQAGAELDATTMALGTGAAARLEASLRDRLALPQN